MQHVQNACLINMVVNNILNGKYEDPWLFDTDSILKHEFIYTQEYDYYNARFLLHLSLMLTSCNFINKKMNLPSNFIDTPILCNVCPANFINNISKQNYPSIIANSIYYKDINTHIIVFTGTYNACLAGLDLEFSQVSISNLNNYHENIKCHKGFYVIYNSIRTQLLTLIDKYPSANLILTGHSLGGALAQLCSLDLSHLNPINYSFGSPLVFNKFGFETYNKLVPYSYRITNIYDMASFLPLPVMPSGDTYYHVGHLVLFENNLGKYTNNHSLAYIQEFELQDFIINFTKL